jgi:hypothetical protein
VSAANDMRERFDFIVTQEAASMDVGISVLSDGSSRQFVMDIFHHVDVSVRVPGDNALVDRNIDAGPFSPSPEIPASKVAD